MDNSMRGLVLEEICGFASLSEYERFVKFVEEHVKTGNLEEVEPNPIYGRGEIYGGRWFRERASSVIWRLIPPDFPFRGLWEPVKRGDLGSGL